MPAINELELKKQIKAGNLSRVYLLHGAEDYLKKLYCKQLADKAVGDGMDDFNGTVRVERVVGGRNRGRGGDAAGHGRKALRDRAGFDAESVNASESAKMTELLKDPPETCVLIFRWTRWRPT